MSTVRQRRSPDGASAALKSPATAAPTSWFPTVRNIGTSYFTKTARSVHRDSVTPHGPAGVDNGSVPRDTNEDDTLLPAEEHGKPTGSLTFFPLFAVLFANCIGSGYGFEQAVGGAGPLITLIACNVLPWFWSLPTGLAVAELASSLPSNSGSIVWINAAYPAVVSCSNIIASITISCLSNASYASLTAEYVLGFASADGNWWIKTAIKVAALVLCTALNVIGVEIVGKAALVSAVVTLSPFIGITIVGFAKYKANWEALSYIPADLNWPQFISIVTWNYSNIDNLGNVVEEVHKPQKTLLRAVIPLMFSTYIAYFLPVFAGVSAAASQPGYNNSDWVEGYWGTVADVVGGAGLKGFLLFGAILSGMGYLLTGLCYSGRQLAGMGEMDAFPSRMSGFLAQLHPRFGTPMRALLLHCGVAAVLSLALSFNSLVAINQVLYTLRLSLIYVAAVKIRWQHPTLARPFRFPGVSIVPFMAAMCSALLISLVTAVFSAQLSTEVLIASCTYVPAVIVCSFLYVRFVRPQGFRGCVLHHTPMSDDDEPPQVAAVVAVTVDAVMPTPTTTSVNSDTERPV
jgi:polyamine:H+ symporter